MGTNQTLSRLLAQSNGILLNPFFEIDWQHFGSDTLSPFYFGASIFISEQMPVWGWSYFGVAFPYSLPGPGLSPDLILPPSAIDDHPFRSSAGSLAHPTSGVSITVLPQQRGGLVQRIPNGRALLGKKVRIYGAYKTIIPHTPGTGGDTPLGVSIWLKGAVHTALARGETLTGTADGNTTAANSTFTTSATALTGVQAGDLLWVGDDGAVGVSGGEWLEVSGSVVVGPPGSCALKTPAQKTRTNANFTVGRRTPTGAGGNAESNWMGDRGVYVSVQETGSLPGKFLRMTEPGNAYELGPEWMIPSLDAFVTHGSTYARHSATDGATDVAGDTFTSAGATFLTDIPNAAGNPILTTWLWLGSQERFYRVSFVTNDTTLELYVPPTAPNPPGSLSAQAYTVYTHNLINDSNKDGVALRLGNADDENNFGQFSYGAAPPYLTAGGPNGSTDQSLLFYMDADDWTSNASGPTYRLMEDTNTYDGQVHYFDEIVEIPATMVLDTDDLWLCVLPYDPADYAATGSFPVSVALYGLQMEYIPEDSATPENRLRQAFLQRGLASGVIGGTYSEKDILRDPIMSRVRLPVDVTAAVVRAGADRAAVGNARLDLFQGTLESTDLYLKYHTNGASDTMSILAIPLPLLPPGSILNTVNLELERTDGGTVNCSLWEFFERRIGYSPGSGEMIRKLGGQIQVTGASLQNLDWKLSGLFGSNSAGILRHRIGFPWPQDDGISPTPPTLLGEAATPFGRYHLASRLWIFVNPVGADIWDIRSYGGYVTALVDRRFAARGGSIGTGSA